MKPATKSHGPRRLVAVAFVASIAIAACGGDDDDSSSPADTTAAASPGTTCGCADNGSADRY